MAYIPYVKAIRHSVHLQKKCNVNINFCVFCLQSKTFEKTTRKVKQKKRWENQKMKVVFVSIGVIAALVILGLIIFAIVNSTRGQ